MLKDERGLIRNKTEQGIGKGSGDHEKTLPSCQADKADFYATQTIAFIHSP